MRAIESSIKELVAFARSHDGEDRTVLYRNLVDIFLTGHAPIKNPTRSQLLDVISALVPHVESDARRTVAELLAGMSEPPMDLVLQISRDRANLVSALLTTAPYSEDDLIELISATGREHHQIIATRSDLSANVWITLARSTPNTPRLQSNSSLALFRDDLASNEDETSNVTPLHTQPKPAQLRILRTADDLLSEQNDANDAHDLFIPRPDNGPKHSHAANSVASEQNHATPSVAQTTQQPRTFETPTVFDEASFGGAGQSQTNHSEPVFEPNPFGETAQLDPLAESANPGDAQFQRNKTLNNNEKQNPLKAPIADPSPTGWAWRSDRDGFITAVSPKALQVFDLPEDRLVSEAMFDLLGLNNKLGHPIARGLQRRSAIHNAPIKLTGIQSSHKHWMLDASPMFHPLTGMFEGYEAALTPVEASSADEDDIATPAYSLDFELDNAPTSSSLYESFAANSAANAAIQDKSMPASPTIEKTRASTISAQDRKPGQMSPEVAAQLEAVLEKSPAQASASMSMTATDAVSALTANQGDEPASFQKPEAVGKLTSNQQTESETLASDATTERVRNVISDAMAQLEILSDLKTTEPAKPHPSSNFSTHSDQPATSSRQNSNEDSASNRAANTPSSDKRTNHNVSSSDSAAPTNHSANLQSQATDNTSHQDVEEALSLLEAAVHNIIEDARSKGLTSVRLQAEIAAACVRVISDSCQG